MYVHCTYKFQFLVGSFPSSVSHTCFWFQGWFQGWISNLGDAPVMAWFGHTRLNFHPFLTFDCPSIFHAFTNKPLIWSDLKLSRPTRASVRLKNFWSRSTNFLWFPDLWLVEQFLTNSWSDWGQIWWTWLTLGHTPTMLSFSIRKSIFAIVSRNSPLLQGFRIQYRFILYIVWYRSRNIFGKCIFLGKIPVGRWSSSP